MFLSCFGIRRWLGKFLFLHHFLKEFVKDVYYIYLKRLIEFTKDAIWTWNVFYYEPNFFNWTVLYRFSFYVMYIYNFLYYTYIQIICLFHLSCCLSQFRWLWQITLVWMVYKQHKFISHCSRGWKSEIRVPAWLGSKDSPLQGCRLQSYLTWWKKRARTQNSLGSFL